MNRRNTSVLILRSVNKEKVGMKGSWYDRRLLADDETFALYRTRGEVTSARKHVIHEVSVRYYRQFSGRDSLTARLVAASKT